MMCKEITFPAILKKDGEEFGVHFPTLLPNHGWDYPLCTGLTKKEAVENGKKHLTFLIAGRLYDNEELPRQEIIPSHRLVPGMELIFLKTAFQKYGEEIEEQLAWRHWHIYFNRDENSEFLAVAYKSEQGLWEVKVDGDLPLPIQLEKLLQICPTYPVISTVRRRVEAEDDFDSFVQKVKEIVAR